MLSNIKQSNLRTLTHNEVNAVSGGIALLPIIAVIFVKIILPTIIHVIDHSNDKDRNKDNMSPPTDPGIPKP